MTGQRQNGHLDVAAGMVTERKEGGGYKASHVNTWIALIKYLPKYFPVPRKHCPIYDDLE